jgi:hypothetical protein
VHFFPGAEVGSVEFSGKELQVEVDEQVRGNGKIWINVPQGIENVQIEGKILPVKTIAGLQLVEINVGLQ